MTATKRTVPLLDLNVSQLPIREELLAEVTRVIDSQKFIMGEDVKLLESDLAAYCKVPHAIGCASGSDALFLAMLGLGISHGQRVITTPFTFFATAGAISRAGGVPVFVDIDPVTYNIDPKQLAAAVKQYPNAKAIVPVHLFGGAADMDPIMEIAANRGMPVIEDGAQSIGAEYKGRAAQSIGDIGCLSFFPSKNLGCFGDGGLLTCKDPQLAKKLAAMRSHGASKKYYNEWIGINSRLDTLQAAVLRVKLRHLDSWTSARQQNAALYRKLLASATHISLPQVPEYQTRHIYNQFVIRSQRRDELRTFLQEQGIGTEIYYPQPLHLQECYKHLGYRAGDFPESEKAAQEVLAIPIYPGLTEDAIEYVADRIMAFGK